MISGTGANGLEGAFGIAVDSASNVYVTGRNSHNAFRISFCGNGTLDPGEECDGGLGCMDCLCDAGFEPTAPPSLDCCPDSPLDSICDNDDNCPTAPNVLQTDTDSDGAGDLCDICPADPTDSCDPDGSTAKEIPADEGGTIVTPDGMSTLDIPPGSLPEDTTISVTQTMTLPNDPPVDVKADAIENPLGP